jgi:hypothetical protein
MVPPNRRGISSGLPAARRKFLRFFPEGFSDRKYLAWERDYKCRAHAQWEDTLNRTRFRRMLREERFGEIAQCAVRIESRTNLLFSFEKMALRDAIKSPTGARGSRKGWTISCTGREASHLVSRAGAMWWRRCPGSKPGS